MTQQSDNLDHIKSDADLGIVAIRPTQHDAVRTAANADLQEKPAFLDDEGLSDDFPSHFRTQSADELRRTFHVSARCVFASNQLRL